LPNENFTARDGRTGTAHETERNEPAKRRLPNEGFFILHRAARDGSRWDFRFEWRAALPACFASLLENLASGK